MTLGLATILVLAVAALLYSLFVPGRLRGWTLLIGSVVAVFALQAALAPRYADFYLPALTLALAVAGWWLTRPPNTAFLGPVAATRKIPEEVESIDRQEPVRDDWLTLIVIVFVVLAMSLFRYAGADFRLTASRPPSPVAVALMLLQASLLMAALALVLRRLPQKAVLNGAILFVVFLFVLLKWPPSAELLAGWWRGLTGQDVTLAAPGDLAWLGFSYVAFRLIHTMRDRQNGLLPDLSLRTYLTYVIFAPAFVAGPIDRAERFAGDFAALPALQGLEAARWGNGLWRIGEGLFKKFVVADLLAQGLSLTTPLATQTSGSAAMWTLLYGYGLRLYFDFGGYSDIAIGLGILFGIRLPENFSRPYFRTNITRFWQSWHITLSDWARFYVFTPLSRALLRRRARNVGFLTPTGIVLIGHVSTMSVIGLWHGITWNFFIWGLWHAAALFTHKVWSDNTRVWYRQLQEKPWPRRGWAATGWFLTLNYVMLGWVWFLLPTPQLAVEAFGKLFGLQ